MNKEHNVNILIVNKKYIFILYAKTVFWWSKKKKKKSQVKLRCWQMWGGWIQISIFHNKICRKKITISECELRLFSLVHVHTFTCSVMIYDIVLILPRKSCLFIIRGKMFGALCVGNSKKMWMEIPKKLNL